MQILLMYIDEGAAFDEARVRQNVADIPGMSETRQDDVANSRLEADFAAAGDSTVVRLSEDAETVSIHGTGAAARRFAVEFQKRYGEPLHLIDDGYSFDNVVDGSQSEEDILRWLQEAD